MITFIHKETKEIAVSTFYKDLYHSSRYGIIHKDLIENSSDWILLNEKPKEKLFTTEDGVDIFEGDKYWFVTIGSGTGRQIWSITQSKAIKGQDFSNKKLWKDFSTKEAANQYVMYNSELLSIQDVFSIIEKYDNKIKDINLLDFINKAKENLLKQ